MDEDLRNTVKEGSLDSDGPSKSSETASQGIRYLVVGVSCVLFELGLYSLLFYLVGWSVAWANITAVVLTTIINFLLNRSWSFKSKGSFVKSFSLYLILFFLNLAFSTFVIGLFTAWGAPSALVKFITQGMIALWNFVLYRKIVFA